MVYNTKAIKTDLNGKPIPQFYNPLEDEYEALKGEEGHSSIRADDGKIESIGASTDAEALSGNGSVIAILKAIRTGIAALNSKPESYVGYAEDDKPTIDIVTGSTFLEIDTQNVYIYDGEEWILFD